MWVRSLLVSKLQSRQCTLCPGAPLVLPWREEGSITGTVLSVSASKEVVLVRGLLGRSSVTLWKSSTVRYRPLRNNHF